jgi:hypothetical protein
LVPFLEPLFSFAYSEGPNLREADEAVKFAAKKASAFTTYNQFSLWWQRDNFAD